MWNDTDIPLGFLITFRTYGNWLHGDSRGSVSRHRNKYGSPRLRHEAKWLLKNTERLDREPVKLSAKQRYYIKAAIRETCKIRKWRLLAINIRTNHVHVVICTQECGPNRILSALKSNATRMIREKRCWTSDKSPWSDKGSTRYLWNEKSVEAACEYVRFGQGDDLPEFE